MLKSLAVAVALTLAAAAPASAVTIAYTDFSSTAGLQINGDAAPVTTGGRTVLRLTPADFGRSGSAFSTSAVSLTGDYSFSTAFTFNINTNYALSSADGLVFVVQTQANNVGGAGGGIGYEGITNSVGVKFDTFQNGGDPSENFVGIVTGGNIVAPAGRTAESPFALDGGQDLTAYIDYNGATGLLEVRLSNNGVRPLAALLAATVDVAGMLGSTNAFVGFTSGTGGAYSAHDIVNWQFNSSFAPIDNPAVVPEPATWAMMVGGFGLVGGALRRHRRAGIRFA